MALGPAAIPILKSQSMPGGLSCLAQLQKPLKKEQLKNAYQVSGSLCVPQAAFVKGLSSKESQAAAERIEINAARMAASVILFYANKHDFTHEELVLFIKAMAAPFPG